MRKKLCVFLFIILSVFMFAPTNANAFNITDNIYIADNETINELDEYSKSNYNNNQNCEGDDSILGSVNDENSVAWLLNQIFNYIKVLGPILIVVLSSIDFIKVIVKSDDEAMAKAQKKLITRLILAVLLFFIPTLIQLLLDIFGITSNATCGIM